MRAKSACDHSGPNHLSNIKFNSKNPNLNVCIQFFSPFHTPATVLILFGFKVPVGHTSRLSKLMQAEVNRSLRTKAVLQNIL